MTNVENCISFLRTLSGTSFSQPAFLAGTNTLDALSANGYILMREAGDGLYRVWLSGRGRQVIREAPAPTGAESRLEGFIACIWNGKVPSEEWIREGQARREEAKAAQARLREELEEGYRAWVAEEGL